MGRYQPYGKNVQAEDKDEFHPIWRGVGCILMVVVPLLAFGLTLLGLQNLNIQVPRQFIVPLSWPGWQYFPPFMRTQNILVILMGTLALTVLIGGLLTFITFVIYKFFGPSRYGPTDMPPIQRQIKKRYKPNR
ncbi:MAG TPA: hypothetical protein PKW33_03245 [Anaerolineaceae bacterium]|nr:hypothetical protein [Anaerolineaceae bacterium]HPN50577.1 hypothetical protein [Anaerolineaceae bacterium]